MHHPAEIVQRQACPCAALSSLSHAVAGPAVGIGPVQGMCAAVSEPGALCMLPGCSASQFCIHKCTKLAVGHAAARGRPPLRTQAFLHVRCCAVPWLAASRQQGQPVRFLSACSPHSLWHLLSFVAALQVLHRGCPHACQLQLGASLGRPTRCEGPPSPLPPTLRLTLVPSLLCAPAAGPHAASLELPAQDRVRFWLGLGACLCCLWHLWWGAA